MPIADRGYQPYRGRRLPSNRNHWVIMSMEMRRIWASLLVKVAVILAALWGLFSVVAVAARGYFALWQAQAAQTAAQAEAVAEQLATQALPPDLVLESIQGQYLFLVIISLAWGSGAIATDINGRALQFYFAKPVTPRSYLLGKILPLATYCLLLAVVPAVLVALVEAGMLRGQGLLASRIALVLPALVYATVVSAVLATGAVAVSSLARSRLLTLGYWAAILFLPWAVAGIVDLATRGGVPWLYAFSPLSMLTLLGQAIFRLDVEGPLQWYHALAVVTTLMAGSVWLAWRQMSRAEVVG
jgi:ABC-type transport system involved in multi-copper enzyme maturation permease subunit